MPRSATVRQDDDASLAEEPPGTVVLAVVTLDPEDALLPHVIWFNGRDPENEAWD